MKKIFLAITTFFILNSISSQTTINQNGLQTTVIAQLSAQATQARSYEIANIGYNSYHWQYGGLIFIEICQTYFSTDYQKYVIESGFQQGANSGSPVIKLVESHGINHSGKVTLGSPVDLGTTFGGYINRQLPIFFNVQNYAAYNIKVTYSQPKVDIVSANNQIRINETPSGSNIPNFLVSTELNTSLISNGIIRVSGGGDHFIQNGNLGIGTTAPDEKLTVKGKIHTQEVRVDMTGALVPDYVFANDYKLQSLSEIESYIKKNNHLPEIPSAGEIEKNGLLLAEMNMNLLKKVEELTLYMIEQNKIILEQNKRLEKLEKIIK
nr:tail fiber protein [uncultured Flavobacterium sp.]